MLIAFASYTAFEVVRTCYGERARHMSHTMSPHPIFVRERVLSASDAAGRLGQDRRGGVSVSVVRLSDNGDESHPTMVSRGASRQFLILHIHGYEIPFVACGEMLCCGRSTLHPAIHRAIEGTRLNRSIPMHGACGETELIIALLPIPA